MGAALARKAPALMHTLPARTRVCRHTHIAGRRAAPGTERGARASRSSRPLSAAARHPPRRAAEQLLAVRDVSFCAA